MYNRTEHPTESTVSTGKQRVLLKQGRDRGEDRTTNPEIKALLYATELVTQV